jgi:hypothetical protein
MLEQMLAQIEEHACRDAGVVVAVERTEHVAYERNGYHYAAEYPEEAQIVRLKDVVDKNLGKYRPEKAQNSVGKRQKKYEDQLVAKSRNEGQQAADSRQANFAERPQPAPSFLKRSFFTQGILLYSNESVFPEAAGTASITRLLSPVFCKFRCPVIPRAAM